MGRMFVNVQVCTVFMYVCVRICVWVTVFEHRVFFSQSACDKNTTEEQIIGKEAMVQYRENTDSLKKTVTLFHFPD